MTVDDIAERTHDALISGDEQSKAHLDSARNLSLRDAEPVAVLLLGDIEALEALDHIVRDPAASLHYEALHMLSDWYTARSNTKDKTAGAASSAIGLLVLSVVPAALETFFKTEQSSESQGRLMAFLKIVYNKSARLLPVGKNASMKFLRRATNAVTATESSSDVVASSLPDNVKSIDKTELSAVIERLSRLVRTHIWDMPEMSMMAFCSFAKNVILRTENNARLNLTEDCYMAVATVLYVCLFSDVTSAVANDCLKSLEELADYEMYEGLALFIGSIWQSNHYTNHYLELQDQAAVPATPPITGVVSPMVTGKEASVETVENEKPSGASGDTIEMKAVESSPIVSEGDITETSDVDSVPEAAIINEPVTADDSNDTDTEEDEYGVGI